MISKKWRLPIILCTAAAVLLLPLIAMQFTEEVRWSLLDFAIAEIPLFGAGILFEGILRWSKRGPMRIALSLALFLVLLLFWAELAVGVFGTPLAGQ